MSVSSSRSRPAGRLAPRALTVALALALAACAAVGPDYQTPPTSLPADWHQAAAAGVGVDHDPQSLRAWWRQFGDPQLDALQQQALVAAPDLRTAQAKLREVRAQRGIAEAGFAPTLSASAAHDRSRSSAQSSLAGGRSSSYYSTGFDASWELDLFGGTRRSVEAASADEQASAANLEDVRVTLLAEVARNYVELRSAQQQWRIAADNLAAQEETLALTRWRQQAGLATEVDVEQARSSAEQTRAAMPPLQTSALAAEHRIEVLLGEVPGSRQASLGQPGPIPLPPARVAIGIPATLLAARPDIRVAERQLAAQTARVGVAEAARYPGFSLGATLGWGATEFSALSGGQALTRSLSQALVVTVFDGGRLRQQVVVQDALQEQALVNYETTVLGALEDVENALVNFGNAERRYRALTDATDAARRAAQLARQRYRAGLIDFQTVLDTQRSQLVLEESLAGAAADRATAVIQLYKACGGGARASAEGDSR